MHIMAKEARLRMMRLARQRDTLKTVSGVEQRTSMNDARIALCVAMGRDFEDIEVTSGHDLSYEAYQDVRESWRWNIQMHGWSDWHERGLTEVLSYWRERRPEFVDSDDWDDWLDQLPKETLDPRHDEGHHSDTELVASHTERARAA